jgi:hypothetical protein
MTPRESPFKIRLIFLHKTPYHQQLMKQLITTLVTKQYLRAGSSSLPSLRLLHSSGDKDTKALAKTFTSTSLNLNSLQNNNNFHLQHQRPADSETMSEAVYDSKTLKESNAKTFKSLGSKLQEPLLNALNDMGYE